MELRGFPGTYQDARGTETVEWRVESAAGGSFELCLTVRGVEIRGSDLDDLEVLDRRAAEAAGIPLLETYLCPRYRRRDPPTARRARRTGEGVTSAYHLTGNSPDAQ